ncbi:MAG: hypothetical protein A2W31_12200 [Planctomycetes bacterium RBG_16_64_10]|nr:MAG: hypothetical protein A2W31_12200 [Planctomycetes bacterium RBG_16_64_10]
MPMPMPKRPPLSAHNVKQAKAAAKRREKIAALVRRLGSCAAAAKHLGISRQRVWAILHDG